MTTPTLHASALVIGERALMILGAAGAGKSTLLRSLLSQSETHPTLFTRLLADDRLIATRHGQSVIVQAPPALHGLLEARQIGLLALPYEASAVLGAVIMLEDNAPRLPDKDANIDICGLPFPCLHMAGKGRFFVADALRLMHKTHAPFGL